MIRAYSYILSLIKKKYTRVLVDQAISSGQNFVFAIIYVRLLGPEVFGKYSLVLFFGYLLIMLKSSFIGTLLSVNIHKYKINLFNYQVYVLIKYCIVVLFSILISLIALKINLIERESLHYVQVFFAFFVLFDLIKTYFLATDKTWSLIVVDVIFGLVVGVRLYLLNENLTFEYIFLINIQAYLASFIFVFFCCRVKFYKPSIRKIIFFYNFEKKSIKHLTLSVLMQWSSARIGFFVLSFYYGVAQVGIITGLLSIIGILNPLFISMDNYILPKASRSFYNKGVDGATSVIDLVMRRMLFIILPVSLIMFIFSGEIVLLVLGQDYSKYSYIFEWLLLVNLLIFMSKKMMYLINIRHYQDIFTKVYFAMTLMVITLSYLLIKDYGINGFIAMSFATGLLLIYLLRYFYKRRLL